ncbi:MAG: tetratricopeptide repeat protein, partial [Planctomycetes bacterium]|nr:tetratricopeptide repeat protein [Planctomycetota bacterium]
TRISLEKRMAEARAAGKANSGDADAEQIKKLEDRVTKFKAIIEMDPGDVLGYFGCGKALLDSKRFREAAEMLAKVVEIQEDYSVAWANLGTAYAALGENDKARETFEKGIEVAREKGDMMPARDMQVRLERLPK